MTGPVTPHPQEQLEQASQVSVGRGLLDRDELLQLLDRAVTKRVTVISAPPGSGKTSLLRGWVDRSTNFRRVASVSVERDLQSADRFWSAVLDALGSPTRPVDPDARPAATSALTATSCSTESGWTLAEQVEPVVLNIDDLHELRSPDALKQLEHRRGDICRTVARAVFSARRHPAAQAAPVQGLPTSSPSSGRPTADHNAKRGAIPRSGTRSSDAGAAALSSRPRGSGAEQAGQRWYRIAEPRCRLGGDSDRPLDFLSGWLMTAALGPRG